MPFFRLGRETDAAVAASTVSADRMAGSLSLRTEDARHNSDPPLQTNQIRRLQTSFAQVAHGETSRVPSSMTSRAPADNDKKSTAIAGIQSRLEKIQGEFQKFLSSVDAIKANVEKAEARKKEVVAVARPLSPGKSATTSLHSTPSLESKLGTSPLDAILNDIHRARQSHEPHPSPVDTGVGAGTFDYKSASSMMDEIKAVRVQIAAGIINPTASASPHNTTILDVDMTGGGEKTHLSEGRNERDVTHHAVLVKKYLLHRIHACRPP